MVVEDMDKMVSTLERQELEATNGVTEPQVYQQLLAIYLYQNDLCNAKFLWKRIPEEIKTSTAELGHIWAVGKHMWKRDFPAMYQAFNAVKWSDTVSEIMAQVQEKTRTRALDLVSQAYSSISMEALSLMLGLSEELAQNVCVSKGWMVEADTKMVHPIRAETEQTGHTSSEEQLFKLTDFVSFLEN